MEFKQIEAFLAISEQKNITKAADSLFVSQSALSYRLKSLEDELGTVLVNRSKGISAVTLSPRGEEFLPIAAEWMEVHNKAMAFKASADTRLIRIAAPTSVNQVFSPVYNDIADSEPSIRLSISTYSSDEIPSLVSRKEVDIGLSYFGEEKDNITVHQIASFPMVIVERSKVPRAETVINPADLNPEKAVLIKGIALDNPAASSFYKKNFGASMHFHISVDTPSMIISSMPEGGWCMIPKSHTEMFDALDEFHIYEIREPAPEMPCYLTVRTSADKALRDFVRKYFMTGGVERDSQA
ncbi:MAG: LysR family transcriptional regulator [Emergencia sp.]